MTLFEIAGTRKPEYEARCRYEGYTPPYPQWYRVLRHTPCGVWLDMGYGREDKFVLNTGRKIWAHATEEAAKESYRMRKIHQIKHLQRILGAAEEGLAHITGKPIKAPRLIGEELF